MHDKHPHPIPAGRRTPPLARCDRERLLGQQARALWLFGLSGSGKTTLAVSLERALHAQGIATQLLDGDAFRGGIGSGLGFSDADRAENIRRAAETARLFVQAGIVTLCAFISPRREHRGLVRRALGDDVTFVYLSAPLEACRARDPKGHYERSARGELHGFTGVDSPFEAPAAGEALALDTHNLAPADCLETLIALGARCPVP